MKIGNENFNADQSNTSSTTLLKLMQELISGNFPTSFIAYHLVR